MTLPRTSHPSRVRRGLKSNLCSACEGGVPAGRPKTFDPRCEGCLAKKARGDQVAACACKQDPPCDKCRELRALGIRTGNEQSPDTFIGNFGKRGATGKRARTIAEFELEAAARRRSYQDTGAQFRAKEE